MQKHINIIGSIFKTVNCKIYHKISIAGKNPVRFYQLNRVTTTLHVYPNLIMNNSHYNFIELPKYKGTLQQC